MNRVLSLLLALAAFATGCSTYRTTTTPRTAVEQALLSEAAEDAVAAMRFDAAAGRSVALSTDSYDAYDKRFVAGTFENRLLLAGGRVTTGTVELLAQPRVHYFAIDDSNFLLGIPSIPLVVPTVGAVSTPELALFRRAANRGRARFSMHFIDSESRALVADLPPSAAESAYTRWTILFFLTFRTTDLEPPF